MSQLDGRRRCAALVLAFALIGWVAASASSAEHPVARSLAPDSASIEPFPTLLVTTSDRPERFVHTRLGEGQRSPWVVIVSAPVIGTPFWVLRSAVPSSPHRVAGPSALGLAGRGPPSLTNA